MVNLVIKLEDSDQPDAVAQVATDIAALRACKNRDELRRVIGNLGIQLFLALDAGFADPAVKTLDIDREYVAEL